MIITFYSYKGGVGRTQLVANIASYLCFYRGKKVLLIEWDMEAPGLHYYFRMDTTRIKKGLIELFNEYVRVVRAKTNVSEKEIPRLTPDYICPMVKSEKSGGKIDLLPAGNYNRNYNNNINDFNWYQFYEMLDGKVYIEYFKDQLKALGYDYIFIDSRTGVSDYSGICNIQMPDMNIFLVAPTHQNFEGSSRIAHSIVHSSYVQQGFRKPIIMPLLSKLDRNDNEQAGKWVKNFSEDFKDIIASYIDFIKLHQDVDEYIENTLLDYKRDLSYGEKVLFNDGQKEIVYSTLEKQYEAISKYIMEEFEVPRFVTNLPSVDMEQVLGREDDLESLRYVLTQSDKGVLVNGLSGTGKTTLAKAFLHRYKDEYNHIAWIDTTHHTIKKAIAHNAVLIDNLKLEFTRQDNIDERFELIMNRLSKLQGNNLLIIDDAAEDIELYRDEIALKPYWKVLITSRKRLEGFRNYSLDFLHPDEARRVFYAHYNREVNHELVNKILHRLDYHPLAITLVAKTAQSSRLTIEEVYHRILKSGLNISDIPLNGYKKLKIMDVLTEEFDVSELETYQQMLIKQFAVLPSEFIGFVQLKDLLSITADEYDRFIQALNALEHKGWLLHNDIEDSFKAHFVVQEVIRHRLPPVLKDCQRLIDNIKRHLENEQDTQRYKCLYYAESILEHLEASELAELKKLVAAARESLIQLGIKN